MSETWPVWAATAFTVVVLAARRRRNRPPRRPRRPYTPRRAVALALIPGSLLIPLVAALVYLAGDQRPGPLMQLGVFAGMAACLAVGWRWTCTLAGDGARGSAISAEQHRAVCALEDPWRRGRREHLARDRARG